MCLGTNVHSPVDMTRDKTEDCTKSDEPPDFTTEILWDSLPMCRSTRQLVASSLRFTRDCHDTVHMKLQDWTVGTSGGISHKESINTTEVKEPILKGNHFYAEHYEISSGDTKGDRKHKPGVLPLEVIDTEVGDCNKTRTCNTHLADRKEFLNKSEDTRYSRS